MVQKNLLDPSGKMLKYMDYYELLFDNFSEIGRNLPETLSQREYIDVRKVMVENKVNLAIKHTDASGNISYRPTDRDEWQNGIEIFCSYLKQNYKRTVSPVGIAAKHFIDGLSAALNPENKADGNFAILWNAPKNALN